MLSIGSAKRRRRALTILRQNHRRDVVVEMLDLSHQYIADYSDKLMGGQVTIDVTADITRSLTLQLLDPKFRIKLDSAAPSDGSMYYTRMMKISVVISSFKTDESYGIPIFCGPINRVDRDGPLLSLEAQGKESLMMNNIWSAKTYKKGTKRTDALKSLMKAGGEAAKKLDIPDLDAVLRTNLSANRKFTFWNRCRSVARGMSRQLFYDGRGQARFRKLPDRTCFTFRDDETILSNVRVSYDTQEVFNAVEVIGGKPKGKKKKIHLKLAAPRSHPLSPWRMGRNGVPRFIPLLIEDDNIKSKKEARRVAKKHLSRVLVEALEVSFDSLPIYFLEEMDLCRFKTKDMAGTFRLRQITYPLTPGGVSTVGYLRNVVPHRGKKRKKKRRKR